MTKLMVLGLSNFRKEKIVRRTFDSDQNEFLHGGTESSFGNRRTGREKPPVVESYKLQVTRVWNDWYYDRSLSQAIESIEIDIESKTDAFVKPLEGFSIQALKFHSLETVIEEYYRKRKKEKRNVQSLEYTREMEA